MNVEARPSASEVASYGAIAMPLPLFQHPSTLAVTSQRRSSVGGGGRTVKLDRGDGPFGKSDSAGRLADQRGGKLVDVGGMTDPGDRVVLFGLPSGPPQQPIEVAARPKLVELDDLRLARQRLSQDGGRLPAARPTGSIR